MLFVVGVLEVVNVHFINREVKSIFLALKHLRVFLNKLCFAVCLLKNGFVVHDSLMNQLIDVYLFLRDKTLLRFHNFVCAV